MVVSLTLRYISDSGGGSEPRRDITSSVSSSVYASTTWQGSGEREFVAPVPAPLKQISLDEFKDTLPEGMIFK